MSDGTPGDLDALFDFSAASANVPLPGAREGRAPPSPAGGGGKDDPLSFDGAAVWAGLDAALRDRLGALALDLICASRTAATAHDDAAARACDGGADTLLDRIDALGDAIPALGPMAAHRPMVPKSIEWCRVCGCTENDACLVPGGPDGAGLIGCHWVERAGLIGCHWVERGLCSACAAAWPGAGGLRRADRRRAERLS